MQIAHHLSELWKNKGGPFLWNTVYNNVACMKPAVIWGQLCNLQ